MILTTKKILKALAVELSLDEMRQLIGLYLTTNSAGGKLWDIMGIVRGPDAPSEGTENDPGAYQARRARKYKGVEVLRNRAFFGMVGGGARHREGDEIELLVGGDHHDRHLVRAASILGVQIKERD